jgi:hypothetical protein
MRVATDSAFVKLRTDTVRLMLPMPVSVPVTVAHDVSSAWVGDNSNRVDAVWLKSAILAGCHPERQTPQLAKKKAREHRPLKPPLRLRRAFARARAGGIHDDASHLMSRNGEEMSAVLPRSPGCETSFT